MDLFAEQNVNKLGLSHKLDLNSTFFNQHITFIRDNFELHGHILNDLDKFTTNVFSEVIN